MTYVNIRLTVADYAKWRAGFDAAALIRNAASATGKYEIFRDNEHPNTVTVITEWADEGKARDWSHSPALREAQQRAGVTGVLDTLIQTRG